MVKRNKDKYQSKNQAKFKQYHGKQHTKSNASTNPDRKLPGK